MRPSENSNLILKSPRALARGRLEGWQQARSLALAILREASLRDAPQDEVRGYYNACSNRQRAGLGGGVALGDLVPVHHVPPRLEIVAAAVLIVEIVGVLPHVIAKQHALAFHQRRILVGTRLERELAVERGRHHDPA